MKRAELKELLDRKYLEFNRYAFIAADPVAIPREYSRREDIEISAFWVAMLAWGQRTTILKKARQLFAMMDHAPYEFIMGHEEHELIPFAGFRHRTFNGTDTLYFIHFFRWFYSRYSSLEEAFCREIKPDDLTVENGLTGFRELFFALPDAPARTGKHIATPARNSACKRLNMFLRWMVRQDEQGVDFGIWRKISPSQLVCPCDVHVDRVARRLGMISRKQTDWKTALELTEELRHLDPADPVKYDFALFGLGLEERWPGRQ